MFQSLTFFKVLKSKMWLSCQSFLWGMGKQEFLSNYFWRMQKNLFFSERHLKRNILSLILSGKYWYTSFGIESHTYMVIQSKRCSVTQHQGKVNFLVLFTWAYGSTSDQHKTHSWYHMTCKQDHHIWGGTQTSGPWIWLQITSILIYEQLVWEKIVQELT